MTPVEDRLRDLRAPDEGAARRRAWELAAAEHAARPSRRRRPGGMAVALAAAVAALLAAVSPPGSAVADWVQERVRAVVDDPVPPRAAALDRLPGGGRLLVLAGDRRALRGGGVPPAGAPWIAGEGDRRRLLGAVGEAAWSPRGRFVAVTRGSELIAVDLRGRRRWSVAAPATARAPSWSPSGFRVAYVAGGRLRVVAGDGTNDRIAAVRPPAAWPDALAVAPAWRPGEGLAGDAPQARGGRRAAAPHVLAFARRREVVALDVDSGRVLWRRPHQGRLATLAFSPRGDRLLVAGRDELRILAAGDGRVVRRIPDALASSFVHATWSPDGRRLAVLRHGGLGEPRFDVVLLAARTGARTGAPLFASSSLGRPAFSPDGRWLLVPWRDRDSWAFLPLVGRTPRLVTGVSRRFGGAAAPIGWCCAR